MQRQLEKEAQAVSGPNPQASSTQHFYEQHAEEYFERTVRADLGALRDRFLLTVPSGGAILDVGCGSGRDLLVFRQRGFRAVGIDSSPALVKLAKDYSGARCYIGRMEDIQYENRFDGIWACASLLHLSKNALVPVLKRLYRALVEGGTLFASVQEGQGELLLADGRFFAYYAVDEFQGALESAGFVSEETFCTIGVLPGRPTKWINVLARRS